MTRGRYKKDKTKDEGIGDDVARDGGSTTTQTLAPVAAVRFVSTLVSVWFSFGISWDPGLSFLASGSLGRPPFFRSVRISFQLESISSVRFGFRSVPGSPNLGPGCVLKK